MTRNINHRDAIIAAGMLAIILYGSLYPFRFRGDVDLTMALRNLAATRYVLSRPGDLLANILFYLPFGFFFARSLLRLPWWATIAAVTLSGVALSISMETLQPYVSGRNSAMSDVYFDAIGTFLGSVTGSLSLGLTVRVPRYKDHFAILLLGSWLGSRLYPYVPVIDLHKYWDALKPLIFSPSLGLLDTYRHAIVWLAIAMIFDALIGVVRSRIAIVAAYCAVLFARVLIARIVLTPSEVVGGFLAILAWTFLLSRLDHRLTIVIALFVVSLILQGLEPFQFIATPRSFGWIPFRGLIQGSIETAMVAFLEKVFNYGCLIWLLVRGGVSWARATITGAILVMTLRLTQVYLPGRSAEITDVVILFIAAGIMRLMSDPVPESPVTGAPELRPETFSR